MIIAIDGPAGAGKSSVSRLLAQRLGFIRVDTGALYRAIALCALRAEIDAQEGAALKSLLEGLDVDQKNGEVFLNGVLERESLRQPEVSRAASDFATLPSVREKLLDLQRHIGRSCDSIVDGRDIGTVVFPDAPLKIYLTASAQARAKRRLRELQDKGIERPFEEVLSEIEERDRQDMSREIAPLKQADDAHLVDATDLNLEEVVEACYQLAHRLLT